MTYRLINGYCPVSDDEHVIKVFYHNDNGILRRHLSECGLNENHSCPHESECPLRAKAPEIIVT